MTSESTSRWIASLILFVLTILGGIGPIYLINWLIRARRRKASQLPVATSKAASAQSPSTSGRGHVEIIHLLTQVGGGVLLYTSLIHMLPEVRDNFRDLVTSENANASANSTEHIPWAFMFWNFDFQSNSVPPVVDVFACFGFFGIFFIELLAHCLLDGQGHGHSTAKGKSAQHVPLQQAKENTTTSENAQTKDDDHHNVPEAVDRTHTSTGRTLVDCLLLILAFSCHSIFDGIAIGVQNGSKIWSLLIAILSHKLLIAFVLCHQVFVKVSVSGSIRMGHITLWLFGVIFALLSPIGVILVEIITGGSPSEDNMTVILLASISAGTLLYIVFMEIIFRARISSGSKQLSALVIGFAVMHVISQFFRD